jgi:hypothetical protein
MCVQYFLSAATMREASQLTAQFVSALADAGFIKVSSSVVGLPA